MSQIGGVDLIAKRGGGVTWTDFYVVVWPLLILSDDGLVRVLEEKVTRS